MKLLVETNATSKAEVMGLLSLSGLSSSSGLSGEGVALYLRLRKLSHLMNFMNLIN